MGEAEPLGLSDHAIIAGYGVPGRAVADWLRSREIPFVVIELNERITERCRQNGLNILTGDVRDEATLKRAGIERARLLALAIPVEASALAAVGVARKLNASLRIIVRCNYTSTGMEAIRAGADDVLVAEQIIAEQFCRALERHPT